MWFVRARFPTVVNGFLNVDKPRGMTSHEVVARVRRLYGQKQVGHAGTLDPEATGVLPVALGDYTRLLEVTQLVPKVYHTQIVLGIGTHTGDAQGREVARSGPPWPDHHAMVETLGWLRGNVWQIPPSVSALKVGGQRHYQAVRDGLSVWPAVRRTMIESLTVLNGQANRWWLEATVGSGTYVRALVRDLGWALGHAAHLVELRRTRVGGFHVNDAHDLGEMGTLHDRVALQKVLESWTAHLVTPILQLDRAQSLLVKNGRPGAWPDPPSHWHGPVGLTYEGGLVAIIDGPPWRLRKVFPHFLSEEVRYAPD